MRKFLWVVAVGTLVLALAAPAMALDFKFGGEFRVRFYTYANGSGGANLFTDGAGTNPRGAQIRVRPQFSVSDDNNNIQAVLRLEVGDVEFGNGGGASGQANGVSLSPGGQRTGPSSGGSIGADGVNVETKWAYIDAAFPFGIPLRARAGIQPWFLPKGLIVDDDVSGVRLYGSVKPVSYEAHWYRVSGGIATAAVPAGASGPTPTSNTIDNNFDFLGGRVDVAIAPWLNPGLYYMYGRNAATALPQGSLDNHYIGVTVTGQVGIVRYDADFVYGVAEGGPNGGFCQLFVGIPIVVPCTTPGAAPVDVGGWVFDAGVHVPIGPVTLNLVGSVSSGDERDGGDSNAFPTIAASWNGPGGLFHIIGSGGAFDVVDMTQDMPTNLWTVGLTADYRPVKPLLVTAGIAAIGFTEETGNCANVVLSPLFTNQPCFGPAYPALSNDRNQDGVIDSASESYLGTEIFLRADYDIWTGFKIQGMMGWLIPSSGSTAGEYILQLLYNF